MQELVSLKIVCSNNSEAIDITKILEKYFGGFAFEERGAEWAKGIEIKDNIISNSSEEKMYDFDYDEIKESLFKRVAFELPHGSFEGHCDYYNGFDGETKCFSQTYNDGLLIEMGKNKKGKLIMCNREFSGTYVMPENITQICDGAFQNCRLIDKVFVSKNVKKIGKDTFGNCNNLTEVHIPATVAKMTGKTIFKNCAKLTIYAPKDSCAEKYAAENGIPHIEE